MKLLAFFMCLYIELFAAEGKVIFEKYCWGCHHQTSMAFGPSFQEIATHRTQAEIIAHIYDPQKSYKLLGYKRSVMPSFNLSSEEYVEISNYILSFKNIKE